MKRRLDMDKIAAKLGAERKGSVDAGAGYFGAAQLLAEIHTRFRSPPRGGRATNPEWSVRRLVGLSPQTLRDLEELARSASESGTAVEPMQVAAVLLETAVEQAAKKSIKKAS